MRYFKRSLIFPLLFLISSTSFSQQESYDYFFQEVGWTITLPYDFTLLDLNDYSVNMQEDPSYGEEDDDLSTDMLATQTMFIAIKDRFNHFNITISPFDPEEDGSWEKFNQQVKDQAYKTMVKIIGSQDIDTTSKIEYIDGLPFEKFHISATINGDQKLEMFLLSRWYKGFDFSIASLCVNDETRKQIELMLKSSRFN